ncbi:hypothetical protein EI77_04269 [Prosthecobacter fusiformis]|uniref:Uncharacterized protein n=1 Tax=Prosthecobacter fusiformis TaxID=48464 RepID=A0A4R7RKE8_9BACT|nr:hypothetical protein [Prosthecobacter fusiformis]TDU64085.1 hypothetical protein EI77_04269 [Prosthecobacter fusiformis]
MEPLIALVTHAGGDGFFLWLAQARSGAHYQKQFDALPPGDSLAFIGCCLALGLLAVWLMHEESKGNGRKRPRSGRVAAAAPRSEVKTEAPGKRRRRKRKPRRGK